MKKKIFAAVLLSVILVLMFSSCLSMIEERENERRRVQEAQQARKAAQLVLEGSFYAYQFEIYNNRSSPGRTAATRYSSNRTYGSWSPQMSNSPPSEQDIDRAISAYEAALNQWPSNESIEGLFYDINGRRITVSATRSEVRALLASARNAKQQWQQQVAAARQAQQQQQQQQQEAQRLVDEAAEAALTTPNSPEDFDVVQNTDGSITITNYKGTRRHVIIPDRLYNLPVTGIGGTAFYDKGLISVVIPNTVISIGDATIWGDLGYNPPGQANGAFCKNNLVNVTLGNRLRYIGIQAFYGNPLTEITIPNSVVEIGQSAFENCRLTRITWGNRITAIHAKAFKNNMLESVVIPNGITVISAGLFENNRLTSIIIPNSVTSIYGFRGNPLTRITLPANLNPNNVELDSNLMNYYVSQGSRAGTYVQNGPVWVRQ